MAAVSVTKSNADDITFISRHDSIVPDDQGLAGKTASKTSGLHYDLYVVPCQWAPGLQMYTFTMDSIYFC